MLGAIVRQEAWKDAGIETGQQIGSELFKQQLVAEIIFGGGIFVPVEPPNGGRCFPVRFWLEDIFVLSAQVCIDDALYSVALVREPEGGELKLPLVSP